MDLVSFSFRTLLLLAAIHSTIGLPFGSLSLDRTKRSVPVFMSNLTTPHPTDFSHFNLPKRCPSPCTERRMVELCYYGNYWHENPRSYCHTVVESTHNDSIRCSLWHEIARADGQDKAAIWDCVVRGISTPGDFCETLRTMQKYGMSPRQERQVHYYFQFNAALAAGEECHYDYSWKAEVNSPCEIVVGHVKAHTRPDGTSRPITINEYYNNQAWIEVLHRDEEDKAFVRHCFVYHQVIKSTDCDLLISGAPLPWVKSTDRRAHLTYLWNQFKRRFDHCLVGNGMQLNPFCLPVFMDNNFTHQRAKIVKCLFSTNWIEIPSDECQDIVNGQSANSTNISEEKHTLHRLYLEQLETNQVRDCYLHHHFEQFPSCYNISWNETVSAGSMVPVKASQRIVWDQLARGDYSEFSDYPSDFVGEYGNRFAQEPPVPKRNLTVCISEQERLLPLF